MRISSGLACVIIWLRSKVWGRATMPCFKTLLLFASRFYNWDPFPTKKEYV